MTDLATALVSFREFLDLPDPANGARFELHDGEVVTVPPAKPLHILAQSNIQLALTLAEPTKFRAVVEFPYRPQPDLQFWYADVAWVPVADLARVLRRSDYVCYAPPLIVEVLSPSNRATTVNRQRVIAISAGTREFWVVDPVKRWIQVTRAGSVATYHEGDEILALGIKTLAVNDLLP